MHKTLLVLSKPSRFDNANSRILAGPARDLVVETLGPDSFDVCYAPEFEARRADYTHIILSGQESLDKFQPSLLLEHHRGFVWHLGRQKIVATYWTQDCCDMLDYESGEDDTDADTGNGKDRARTSRRNYRFWFKQDCAKLFNTPPCIEPEPFCLLTNAAAAAELRQVKNSTIYFDIESHPNTNTITCFSYAIDDQPTKTVVIYDHRDTLVDGAVAVMAALARAFSRNKFVIHNSFFDLLFLAVYHNVPAGTNVEDTMLIGHRIWPEAEKSLAHHISLYVNSPYHKDEGGTWHPRNSDQLHRLLRYNAKDVTALRAVHRAQWRFIHAANDPGLTASVVQVNASIAPYLYTSFHGLPYNAMRANSLRAKYQRRANQFQRLINVLAGAKLNPNSPAQMAKYFIDGLGYPILERTETGAPRIDEAILYRYLIKFKNPIIRAILAQKRANKVAGALGFEFFQPLTKR